MASPPGHGGGLRVVPRTMVLSPGSETIDILAIVLTERTRPDGSAANAIVVNVHAAALLQQT